MQCMGCRLGDPVVGAESGGIEVRMSWLKEWPCSGLPVWIMDDGQGHRRDQCDCVVGSQFGEHR